MKKAIQFDLSAKRPRLSDRELLAALKDAAETIGPDSFSTQAYDALPGSRPHSATLIARFGSWKKALLEIGVVGVREREIVPEALVENLECVWTELGYPPGRRQLVKHGQKYSQHGYVRVWGSLRAACEALADFHAGRISRSELLAGKRPTTLRKTISLKVRWLVLKRDQYTCQRCGASPAKRSEVGLEIDHIVPVSKGGTNAIENLVTLCSECNGGKSDE